MAQSNPIQSSPIQGFKPEFDSWDLQALPEQQELDKKLEQSEFNEKYYLGNSIPLFMIYEN